MSLDRSLKTLPEDKTSDWPQLKASADDNSTNFLILHFETVSYSKKLQTTTEMWLVNDFKIQI